MRIEELKKEYKDELLAIKVTKEKDGKAIEGELKYHCKDRKEIWKKAKKVKEKGYATAFSTVDIDSEAPILILKRGGIYNDNYFSHLF